jgi:hypothetical protein
MELHSWVALSQRAREEWLDHARQRYFSAEHPQPQAPPGHVFELAGKAITDLTSFFCAMGEAINGPGGYFGAGFHGFDDCCVGGFGATPPCTIRWNDASVAKRALDHAALAAWARQRLETHEFLDGEGAAWLADTIARAERDEGETLFDMLVETMRDRGISVEETECLG